MPRTPCLRALTVAGLVALTPALLGACGGDDKGASATSSTMAPEDVKLPLPQVLAKLPTLVELGNKAAEAGQVGAFDDAEARYKELHEVWFAIEGTVKSTDQDLYERFESAQGLMNDGAQHHNAERIQQGADDQSDAADAFLTANAEDPGTSTSVTTTGQP